MSEVPRCSRDLATRNLFFFFFCLVEDKTNKQFQRPLSLETGDRKQIGTVERRTTLEKWPVADVGGDNSLSHHTCKGLSKIQPWTHWKHSIIYEHKHTQSIALKCESQSWMDHNMIPPHLIASPPPSPTKMENGIVKKNNKKQQDSKETKKRRRKAPKR